MSYPRSYRREYELGHISLEEFLQLTAAPSSEVSCEHGDHDFPPEARAAVASNNEWSFQ